MRKILTNLILLVISISCASYNTTPQPDKIEISEINPNKQTVLARQNIKHLMQVYDLGPFLYVKKIQISTLPLPMNSKTLNLDARFSNNPNKLLSRILHAQLHIWLMMNNKKTHAAVADLKKVYIKIPNETLPQDNIDNFRHLIICFLEFEALKFYLGEKETRSIIYGFMKKEKMLPWSYYQVLNKNFAIKQIIRNHQLLPAPLL